MIDVIVRSILNTNIIEFLEEHEYYAEQIADGIYKVTKEGELPVFVSVSGSNMFFQVDLGSISEIKSEELFFKLLDLNTEILPVSVGVDTTNPKDSRLVIVESREICNLDDNELLGVFSALQLATDKVEMLLANYLN